MIAIGKRQTLVVDHIAPIGPYLSDPADRRKPRETVLLPAKEMPKGCKEGDLLAVFVYRDSGDRPIATLRMPAIALDEIRVLKVVAITKIGAFVDWGLEKDLLLPFSEQTVKVQIGRKYPMFLYLDKSERLCATMKIFPHLKGNSPYQVGDTVQGYVYQINPEKGAFVAVAEAVQKEGDLLDLRYHGMVHLNELGRGRDIHCGDTVTARVASIREDGKLNLMLGRKAYKEMPKDAKTVMFLLERGGGYLPYNDKTPPAVILSEFHMSKGAFKRALGNLMKARKIKQTDRGIMLIQ